MAAARRRLGALCQRRCRYSLLVFAPSAAVVLLVSGTLTQRARQTVLADLQLHQDHAVDLAIQALTADLDLAVRDLQVLERRPELQRMLVDPSPANRAAFAQVAGVMAESVGLYDKIRWLDQNGHERAGIDWDGRSAVPLPDGALQDRSRTGDVRAARKLPLGSIYVSPMDLNVETGRIETPHQPVLRLIRPLLSDATSQRQGFLVFTMLAQPMLEAFSRKGVDHGAQLMLVNRQGYGLRSPQPSEDWGFLRGEPARLPRRAPEAWRLIEGARSGQRRLESGLWTWRVIQPFRSTVLTSERNGSDLRSFGTRPRWIAVSQVNAAQLRRLEGTVTLPLVGGSALLLAGLAGLSAWIGRRLEQGRQDADRLALVAQNAADVVFAADGDGRLSWVSESATTLVGLERGALLGRSIAELLLEEDRPLAQRAQEQVAGGEVAQFEARVRDVAGREHWLEISVRPVTGTAGRLNQAGHWRTIDAERQTERARRQADRRLAALMANAPVGMVVVTTEGRLLEVNPAFCAMLERDRQELLATDWQDLTHPADLAGDQELVQQMLSGELETFRRRKRYLKPDGRLLWGDVSVAALHRDDGTVESFIAQVIDITATVASEQKLAASQRRYRLLAENASDVVLQADHRHRLQWFSPSAPTLFATRAETLSNSVFPDWLHPEDQGTFDQLRRRLETQTGAPRPDQGQLLRLRSWDNTYRWVSLRLTLLRDRGHSVYGEVLALRDVDAETTAWQQLDRQQTYLRATLNSLLDPHITLDPLRDEEGRIVDFLFAGGNPASYNFIGMPPNRLLGKRLTSIFPGVAEQGLLDRYRHVMETGEPLVLTDFLYSNQEVLEHDIITDLSAVRAADSLSLTWRDVTERYSKARALAESEERYRLLAENAADLIVRIKDNRLVWLSSNAITILGAPPQHWINRSVQELLHPDDLASYLKDVTHLERSDTLSRHCRIRTADGEYHWFSMSVRVFRDGSGGPDGISAALRNIDAEVAAARELDYRASHDLLTGLLNRREVIERLEVLLSHPDPRVGHTGLLFIDVDRFKQVNDSCGHAAGDAVLITLTERIRSCLRQDDLAARMGGDELLVVLQGLDAIGQAVAIAEKLRLAGQQPIPWAGGSVEVSLSIGVALAAPGENVDGLIARADQGMYSAKQGGRNQVITVASQPGLQAPAEVAGPPA